LLRSLSSAYGSAAADAYDRLVFIGRLRPRQAYRSGQRFGGVTYFVFVFDEAVVAE
jgi:hypothetical protein